MVGRSLGHYEILEPLGAGGMGEVYRARDTRLDRDVAIKVLPAEFAEHPERLARFEREAKLLAALDHPHIAVIHALGEAGGTRFIAMELVEGRTLEQSLAAGPVPLEEALEICRQITEALEVAHDAGIIHRDLKPANVVVTAENEAKVLDFGVATAPEFETGQSAAERATALTSAGAVVGTAPYMSPEQVRGTRVDGRADLWSLGCLLYELLTGRRAFDRDTVAQTLAAILEDEPDWDALPGDTPVTVRSLLRRCLEKDPGRRLHDVADARAELEEALQELDSLEPEPSGRRVVPSGSARRAVGAFAALALIATLLLGFDIGGLRGYLVGGEAEPVAASIDSLAVLPFANLTGDPGNDHLADGMTEELITELGQIAALDPVISRTSVMRFKDEDERPPLPEIGDELGVDGIIEASLLEFGERVRISVRLYQAATEERRVLGEIFVREKQEMRSLHADVALAVVDAIEAPVTASEAERLARTPEVDPAAYEAYQLGRFHWNRRTGEELERARDYFEEAVRLDPEYAEAYAGLADCYVLFPIVGVMRPLEASRLTRDAARVALEIDSSLAEAHAALAYALMLFEWDWDDAERAFQRALQLNPNYGTAHFHYAAYLAAVGRSDESIQEVRRAREVDPVSPIINAGVAWMQHLARDDQEAVAWARRALDLEPDFAIGQMRLGIALQHLGRHAEAIASLERAVEVSGHEWMPDLGQAYGVAGRREEALETLERLETISQRRYVPAYGIATIHAALGEEERALQWLQTAFQERSWDMPFIRVEREMDPLRTDPRFQDIVRRMDFPENPGS